MLKNIKAIVYSFVIGTLTGATVSILFTPYSGKETREIVLEKTNDLQEKLIDDFKHKEKQVKKEISKSQKRIKKVMRNLKNKFSK